MAAGPGYNGFPYVEKKEFYLSTISEIENELN